MSINFKTQTKRSTKFHTGIMNINLFCNNFEFGITTSQRWGDFEEREQPLIEIGIKGQQYQMDLSEFIKEIEPILMEKAK